MKVDFLGSKPAFMAMYISPIETVSRKRSSFLIRPSKYKFDPAFEAKLTSLAKISDLKFSLKALAVSLISF